MAFAHFFCRCEHPNISPSIMESPGQTVQCVEYSHFPQNFICDFFRLLKYCNTSEVFQISAIDFSKIFPNFTGHEIQGKTSPILLIKTELFNE